MKTILSIAGSDPSAGAGIQQDLKVITLLGGYGLTALTALTVQNTTGVRQVAPVAPELVGAQLEAIFRDIRVDAVKVGMLATSGIVRAVAAALHRAAVPIVVVDPVLAASDGTPLLEDAGLEIFIKDLLPLATLLTPNLAEASRLTGLPVATPADMEQAAQELQRRGPQYVLVKGGHLPDAPVDVLAAGRTCYRLPGERLASPHRHGTGCALAAAVATHLALGRSVPEAVNEARQLVAEAIRWGLPLGQGRGPVHPAAPWLREQERFLVLHRLAAAGVRLQEDGVADLIPEVQSNLGYATLYPRGPQDVAAFPGRILRTPQGVLISREPAFGASRHIANIILTAGKVFPEIRAAMNIRFFEEVERLAPLLHLSVAGFDRRQEPTEIKAREGSSLAWGVAAVLAEREAAPDLIYDRGDWGKEPMIRILGPDPMHVVEKVLALAQALRLQKRRQD